ncbi:MAG: hypothetical protein NT040_16750 [Bacteroidetes bacterium]|nr:hypothetical protein [Bacteroidota bacterium]
MKSAKNYAIISLMIIFATATSSFAGGISKITSQPSVNGGIRHQVNVIISSEKPLCNTYLIEIRDGHGQLVAPAQRYISGTIQYNFAERGPASGVRVARLVRAYGDHFICENELFTTPAVVTGPFENGQTCRFDLYPSSQPSKQ